MLVDVQWGLLHKADVQSRYSHSFLLNHKVGHVTCFYPACRQTCHSKGYTLVWRRRHTVVYSRKSGYTDPFGFILMSTLVTWYRRCAKGQQEVSRNHMKMKLCSEIKTSKCKKLYRYMRTIYWNMRWASQSFLEHVLHSLLHCCKLSCERSFKEGYLGTTGGR